MEHRGAVGGAPLSQLADARGWGTPPFPRWPSSVLVEAHAVLAAPRQKALRCCGEGGSATGGRLHGSVGRWAAAAESGRLRFWSPAHHPGTSPQILPFSRLRLTFPAQLLTCSPQTLWVQMAVASQVWGARGKLPEAENVWRDRQAQMRVSP